VPVAQAAQPAPQWLESLLVSKAQGIVPPHAAYPGLQAMSQLPPLHTPRPNPFAGGGQTRQFVPQWLASFDVW
jgi:hypothetical protein